MELCPFMPGSLGTSYSLFLVLFYPKHSGCPYDQGWVLLCVALPGHCPDVLLKHYIMSYSLNTCLWAGDCTSVSFSACFSFLAVLLMPWYLQSLQAVPKIRSLLVPHFCEQKLPDSLAFQTERQGKSVHNWCETNGCGEFKSEKRKLFSRGLDIPNTCDKRSGSEVWLLAMRRLFYQHGKMKLMGQRTKEKKKTKTVAS